MSRHHHPLVATLALLLSALPILAQPVPTQATPSSARALAGGWVGELHLGPEVRGELVLRVDGDRMEASIDGHSAPVTTEGRELRFSLPGDIGSFRGSFDETRERIHGHWIQPPSPGLGYPHATPIVLHAAPPRTDAAAIYRGEVAPLEDRMRFYLVIREEEATPEAPAAVRAVMRNPERNLGRYLRLDRVELTGDRVTLLDVEGEPAFAGRWHSGAEPASEKLVLDFPRFGRALELRRSTTMLDAAGFWPSLASVSYRYRAPLQQADGDDRDWPLSTAQAEGVDPVLLEGLIRELQFPGEIDANSPYVHAVLVARNGKLVLEQYFYTQRPDEPHDTRSAGKSLASMLVGAAIDRREDFDTTTRFLDVFGEVSPEPRESRAAATLEQRRRWREALTLGHLLSMSSGLDCDDDDPDSPGNEGLMQDQSAQPDWTRYGLDLPMVRAPGELALYCSNSINLAAATMAERTGRWLPEAFAEWIATPLGIERYHFNLSPAGDGYMGGGIRLTPRDQAKLGQVMLDEGLWRDRRVLSAEWVRRSVSPHAGIHEEGDYGYAWWRLDYGVDGRTIPAFYASGNGGQLTIVIPELSTVVQFSAGNYGNYGTWRHYRDDLVPRFVIPAVLSGGDPEPVR